MKLFTKFAFFVAFVTLCHTAALAQVATLTPAKPQVGQTITVTYDPRAQGAILSGADEIYVFVRTTHPREEKKLFKLAKDGAVYKREIQIDPNWSSLGFQFRSAQKADPQAKLKTMIYGTDGNPVRHALLGKVEFNHPYTDEQRKQNEALFAQELSLYPNNYTVQILKWISAGRLLKTEEWKTQVSRELEELLQKKDVESLEWLHTVARGHLNLKQYDKVVPLLQQMIAKQATSPFTTDLFGSLSYNAMAGDLSNADKETITQMELDYIRHYPTAKFARDRLGIFGHKLDGQVPHKDFPLAALEVVAQAWFDEESENPEPLIYLSRIYLVRNQKLERAAQLIEQGIQYVLLNKEELYRGYSMLGEELHFLYQTKAELQYQLGRFAPALESIKAAQMLERSARFKTTDPDKLELEGKIWLALNNPAEAEKAFVVARFRGSDLADKTLKEIYQKREGKLDGFREYLKKRTTALLEMTPAAKFTATALDGKTYDSAALKGKVIVLNFWFIGCGPCRVEMPGLNELIKEYKGKDVVFLAFATDEENDLREFLKSRPFDYQIVPKAFAVNKAFNVSSWPAHILIDREGNQAMRLIGGSEKRHHELRKLIDRLLE